MARSPQTIARLRLRDEAIIAMTQEHPELTLAQVGERMGLSCSMVSRIMASHRRMAPTRVRLAKRDAALLDARLRVPPPSLAALGEEFGISVSSVIRAIHRAEKVRSLTRKRVRGMPLPSPLPSSAAMPAAQAASGPSAPLKSPFSVIDRSPCTFCGVRGDIGCSHRSAS